MSRRLSDGDIRRLEPLRRVLVRPLDYDAIDDWRGAVNRELATAFGADGAVFQLSTPGRPLLYSNEFDPDHLAAYEERAVPRLARDRGLYGRMSARGCGNRALLWGRDLSWFYESEYFTLWARQLTAFDPLWAAVPGNGGTYPAVLSAYHDTLDPDRFFEARDVHLMSFLRPTLEAGVRTVLRAAANRAALVRSLDAQSDGVLLFELDGRLLHRNPAVARMATTREAESEIIRAGRSMAGGLAGGGRRELMPPESVTRSVTTRAGTFRLTAVVVGPGVFSHGTGVLVTVVSDRLPLPGPDAVVERFGLTPRQAEVALLLAERKTNPEIAEILCISEHTVDSHVQAAMRKLGVHDRRDVCATLTRDPAS